ncbi:MAG: MAPEG family protein [Parvularculaceae bacterium]
MTAMQAAGFWVGLHALLLIYLSYRVGKARSTHKIDLGDGGVEDVQRAIRTHGNYTEYAPLALIGLFGLAMLGAPASFIHGLGGIFFFGRIAHMLGLGMGAWKQGRMVGTLLTMLTLLVTSVSLLIYAIS